MIDVENLIIAKAFRTGMSPRMIGRSSSFTPVIVAENDKMNHGSQQTRNKTAMVAKIVRHFPSCDMQECFRLAFFDIVNLRTYLWLLDEMALNITICA
jgi:hypothetical protein